MTETLRPELTGVAGVPETALSPELVATLGPNECPAPWTCTLSAVAWWHRGGKAARAALPSALRGDHRGLLVVGAMVSYSHTPVGAYEEVLGIVAARKGLQPFGTVAFMSVDSLASLVGGRSNWAMPKTLGRFSHRPASNGNDTSPVEGRHNLADHRLSARGDDHFSWSVTATPRPVGPRFPVRTRALTRQQFPGQVLGAATMKGFGRARLALVDVEVTSDGPLPTWLKPGKHLGIVVESATFTLGETTF